MPAVSFLCASTDDPSVTDVRLTDEQLNKLVSCYNSFSKDLFKNTLLTWYASCDKNLNGVRLDLFTILSRKDDFPFRVCILKRRAQRTNGENLADKLTNYIYTLVSVYVEGDYDSLDLGNIISSRRRLASIRPILPVVPNLLLLDRCPILIVKPSVSPELRFDISS